MGWRELAAGVPGAGVPSAGVPAAGQPAADAIERLGGVFFVRLQNERMQLATLSAELARSEGSPVSIFEKLQFRAHKLKGAAAIFEFPDLAAAAHALERASAEAVRTEAEQTNPGVWSALVALVDLLGEIDHQGPRHPLRGAGEHHGQPAQ
jgi:HPt (histidine-containing phosphotransfer) domain-containing protein